MSDRKRRSIAFRLARIVILLIVLVIVFAGAGLVWAHIAIRDDIPPLPRSAALAAVGSGDLPVRLSWIETASQRNPARGGKADEWQRVVHSIFVLEWSDGRLLLVDTGMDADYARAFGRPAEWILGAQPIDVGRNVADALGAARRRLAGVVFTHLHPDHTQGIGLLCPPDAPPFSVFMTPTQSERPNYTTRAGLAHVQAASCARTVALPDSGIAGLPGQQGVGVIRVAGHTPDSQLVVAWIASPAGRRAYLFAGDVVFEKSQIAEDRPKPLLYRLLITPENDAQLGTARRWLRSLEAEEEITVIPSHDQAYLESLGLPRFDGARSQ